ELRDRALASKRGEHDFELLLRRELPVLAVLAQPSLLLGRAAHPEPAAGRSLRRHAPPRSSGTPTQLPVNTGPGSRARPATTTTPRSSLPSPTSRSTPIARRSNGAT